MNDNPSQTHRPSPPQMPGRPGRPRETFQYEAMENGPGLSAVLNALLKSPGKLVHEAHDGNWKKLLVALLVIAAVCLAIYGAVIGSQAGGWQLLVAPAKIVLVVFLSALICFPSLYIFMSLSGIDTRLASSFGALLALVALGSLLLVGLAPVAWVFAQSTESTTFMGILHLLFLTVALFFGIRSLWAEVGYHPQSQRSHLRVWVIIFIVVTLQMLTVFRPIMTPSEEFLTSEKKFFLQHWFQGMAEESGLDAGYSEDWDSERSDPRSENADPRSRR